ncbi:MAG: hypothetical protein GX597_07430 [Anaerolineaceae bacterium]|nr:hypothetical protein [Anaerolineaceae bacterium]
MLDLSQWITGGLILSNQVLAATVLLTSFSLLTYLLTHNLRSPVVRGFCALLAFMLIVYAGDVVLYEVESSAAAVRWLKFQWVGIAFVPAAYLHFSDALLATMNLRARWRRVALILSYIAGALFLGLVLWSELVVYDGIYRPQASHLAPGPLFWIFGIYFVVVVLWGEANIQRARKRCLTRASRRRMTYMGLAFVAPALGVFPYLMFTGIPALVHTYALQLFLLVGNAAVLLMIVLMAYSVAFFGVLSPDRVIKHRLIHYLLRGPLVGAAVLFVMLAVPKVQAIFGLPRDTVLILSVVGIIVLLQIAIDRARPVIDRLIYRQDRNEIAWIQTLDRRLLTTADLRAFLENNLAALCDLLQVRTGFVAVMDEGQQRLEAHCGDRTAIEAFLQEQRVCGNGPEALLTGSHHDPVEAGKFLPGEDFWLMPLRAEGGDVCLGVLGVEARSPAPALAPGEQELVNALAGRAQDALEDRYLQQNVFETLNRILPNIERLHRWQDATRYAGTPTTQIMEDALIYSPEFQQWVRDALSHYWGGPKLTESPLLELRVVARVAREQGANPVQALRVVLGEAIERLRPAGERSMTTTEWILYNILELKFVRGLRVRDVARRLAMSESDLYRKQRIAIAEVARSLADLEQAGAAASPAGDAGAPGSGNSNAQLP